MGYCDVIALKDVDSVTSFAAWVQQITGAPTPNGKEWAMLHKTVKQFFAKHPGATYQDLCATVLYCKQRKRRFPAIFQYVSQYKYAWAAGCVADRSSESLLEQEISRALEVESDRKWRSLLAGAQGTARREVYQQWLLRAS